MLNIMLLKTFVTDCENSPCMFARFTQMPQLINALQRILWQVSLFAGRNGTVPFFIYFIFLFTSNHLKNQVVIRQTSKLNVIIICDTLII